MKNIVIGAGPSGRLAGLELGRLGEETILIEKKSLGGTCLNEGCMVICALTDIARFLNNSHTYENLGLIKGNIEISYSEIVKKIKETQKIIHKIDHEENTSQNNHIIYGEAEIINNQVVVNGESLDYKNLLIATGANPFNPNIKGIEHSINNKDILKLKKIPEKLNIIGGSIIAAEVSNIYSSLGSEVNIIARSEFLKELDAEVKEYIIKKMLKNVKIHENTETLEIKREKTIIKSKTHGGEISEIEGIAFIATGRSPNSKIAKNILKSDEFDKKGAIIVNKMMQTKIKNVYAAGDVIGGINLTPIARMGGIIAARNMAGYSSKIEYNCIPQSINLDMPISFVRTSKKANDINDKTKDILIPGSVGPESFWKVLGKETGMTKASFNEKNELLKSITAISPSSISDIAYLSYLMRIGENITNFDDFIEVHPSTDVFFHIMKYI